MQFLVPRCYPQSVEETNKFGREHLETLLNHYGQEKTCDAGVIPPVVSREGCLGELATFQRIVLRNRQMETLKFWQLMITSYSDIYPAIIQLAVACLVILMSNAACERVFSTQNRIKSRLRSSMKISTLDMLMRISIEGPEIEQMDYAKALEYFKRMKNRRLF